MVGTERRVIVKRRICWPNPDATCLEGGCSYCNGHDFQTVAAIRRYAESAGVLPNRAHGEQPAIKAFHYGLQSGWNNVRIRTRVAR